jgi:hypothetical protein
MQSACLDCKNPTLIFEEVLDPFPELLDFRRGSERIACSIS